MDSIAGYATTGRTLKGPASDLVELKGDRGQMLSAIVFHPEYREHRGINGALEVVARFLEDPMVPDLVEMVGRDPDVGAFVYPTGQVWAVADVIRILADLGETAGVRAGLELMHRAGSVLAEAADFGASENVYSHGGLTPWRLVMRQDGRVLILGHALPQVEILMFHDDHTILPPSDSFRYCPPERIHGEEEDLTSDLFSLCLIAFEFITGRPVYDGLVNDIRAKAARGEASQVLFRARDTLPATVREILGNSMRLEKHDRFGGGEEFLDAVAEALSSGDARGPSLADVMRKVSSQMQRRGVVPDSASTVMGTPEEIRAMLDDDDDELNDVPKREKWQPASRARQPRRRRQAEEAPPEPPPPTADEASEPAQEGRWSSAIRRSGTRRKVRRSTGESDPEEALSVSPPLGGGEPEDAQSPASPRFGRVSSVRRGVRRRAAEPTAEGETAASGGNAEEPRSGIEEALRSSRVRKPRRTRSNPSGPTPDRGPPDQGMAGQASESLSSSNSDDREPSTSDLLARIRQSATRSRRSSVDRPSAASDLIRELAQSSGRRTKPAADSVSTPDDAESASEASNSSKENVGRVRRVRRARRKDSDGVEEQSSGAAQNGNNPVEEHGSAGDDSSTSTDSEQPAQDARPDQEAPPATRADDDPSAAASHGAPDADAARKPAPPASKSRPAAPVDAAPAVHLGRPPAPVPSTTKGGAVAFVVRREPGGRGTRVRLPKEATTAEAVGWIVPNLVPVRTDLSGRLTGWYRFSVNGEPVPAQTLMRDLDPEQALVVCTVPNTTQLADLTVPGSPPMRFVAPVGMAVPVATLIDHLTAWLGLPSGPYELQGPEGALDAHSILADLAEQSGPIPLTLKAAQRGESK